VQEFELELPDLFLEQEQILESAARFTVVHGGAESGLTTLAIDVLLMSPLGALNGYDTAFCVPDADDVLLVKRRIVSLIHPLILNNPDRPRLDLATGGSIRFVALNDEEHRLWDPLSLVVVDSAARAPRVEHLWDTLLAPLVEAKRGQAWFFSKPDGVRNGFASLAQRAATDQSWATYPLPTSANPYRSAALLEEERGRLTADEFAQERNGDFVDSPIRLSAAQRVIRSGETFRMWCERLGRDGLKVDGKPFTLDDRPAMAWIYDQIPSTEDAAYRLVIVLMKCAQVGFTVMEMLATIYLGLRFGPATVGMFLPDQGLAEGKSSERFMPVVQSVPEVHTLMTQRSTDGSGVKKGEGNVRRRRIGDALFLFSWTSGRSTTESFPMDVLSFDEVQEMTLEQMEKTVERLSASPIRLTIMGSTANWPDADIHHWHKRGSQNQFHTRCQECGVSKPLDEYFPDCIRWDSVRTAYRYVCPNGHWLEDTQVGDWIAENPEADPPVDVSVPKKERPLRIRSIHFPQFLSPTISAGEIMDAYNSATDMKNFFNRKLGKPYSDPSQVPVTLEHCAACVEAGKQAGIVWKQRAKGTYMGIDQMGNFNVHVIKERLPDGRRATIHIEETYSEDPFARSSELMELYGVSVCVVEVNPNYNDAHKFALRHPGKVFIVNSFGSIEEGMIAWGDASKLDSSERRTDEESRDRWTLRMDQYKCMQVSMSLIVEAKCLFPDPQGLVQEVIDKGVKQNAAVAPRMFHHFTKTALVNEISKEDEKAGIKRYRRSVRKIGIDPHFSYANMLSDVAYSRAHGTSTFIFPDEVAVVDNVEVGGGIAQGTVLNRLIEERESIGPGKCSTCSAFDPERSWCDEREVRVRPVDVACYLYVED
jgi:hypothetical protein